MVDFAPRPRTSFEIMEDMKARHVSIDPSLPRKKIGPGAYMRMLAAEDPTIFDYDLEDMPKLAPIQDFLKVQPVAHPFGLAAFMKAKGSVGRKEMWK